MPVGMRNRTHRWDVVSTAFAATGATVEPGDARCARCATDGVATTPTTAVVSRSFTGYDDWAAPAEAGLCRACAWSYRAGQWRRRMHVVRSAPTPTVTVMSPRGLQRLLSRPLANDTAVVVPLRPGRKHVLPHAQWGTVAVDDGTLAWVEADVAALAAMIRLRLLGFGAAALSDPAPPWRFLRGVPDARWSSVLADWEILGRRRGFPMWWDLAVRASTPARSTSRTQR